VLQAPEQRFPAARGADHGEAGCPCSHGGPRGSRSPSTAQGGPHARAGGCPKEAATLWGACAGAGLEREKEEVAEMCDELTTAPIPHPPALLRGKR